MEGVAVHLEQASVRFGYTVALDGFTGEFDPGTITALIGGDGAGKSTLLKVLASSLRLGGGSAQGLPVDRTNLGYQSAESGVWRNLSVAENIEFVARTYKLDPSRTRERSDELLRRAGLDHVTGRLAGRLSGGMRQKLGVVLATLHEPGLVLFDEPTTGVDPISRVELWSLIASIAADGATVVFSTTYLDEAERATRLYLLGEGRLLGSGTPDDVIDQTPGVIWQAPFTNKGARRVLDSGRAWRRGEMIYLWEPEDNAYTPEGFEKADADLENTSIALLMERANDRKDTDAPVAIPMRESKGRTENRSPNPLVEAKDVTRAYGAFKALDEVSLEVRPGEIVGLLGGNGAGKTTLMRILLGLENPSSGTATRFGQAPSLESRRHIGYVAQGLGLYPALSAIENLEFAASVQNVSVGEQVRDVALRYGRAPIASLPLGTKRILAYLAASLQDPELLVLDEPTSGMDGLTRARLWRDLRASADRGTGILVTTHYMQEATQCDRLVVLTAGQVTASGILSKITGTRRSLMITTDHWEDAFKLMRESGVPTLLDGRTLRVPGASRDQVAEILAPIVGDVSISEGGATLEETIMLDARVQLERSYVLGAQE